MAADRIKGITIEIGGDAAKLASALKDVNGHLKDNAAQLRDLDKLLKLDPGNTTLLQQKFKVLGDSIEQAKSKLQTLKEAEKQLADSGQVGTKEWDSLQREIADTEGELRKLTTEYDKFGDTAKGNTKTAQESMKEFGNKVSDVGKKITVAGAGMTAGITVPVVSAAKKSVDAWKEVDEAMDTIVTKTGATGEALSGMQDIAKGIATTLPVSFQEAADAVSEVNTRFGSTGQELETLSTKFAQFAKMNDVDVSTSIDSVQASLAAFGLSSQDVGLMLDVLNKAGQDTGISVTDLSNLLTANAPALKEMGYSASDSAMMLANLSKNGVDTTAAMTGLKKAYAESIKSGVPLNEMLGRLERMLGNSSTQAEASAEAMKLFGNRAGGQLVSALEEGRMSFESLGTSMIDFAGNVNTTFTETLDPLDQTTVAMNQMKEIGSELVTAAGPMLTQILGQVVEVIKGLCDAWKGLDEDQQQAIIKLVMLAAAAGPVVTAVGGMTTAIGALISAGSGIAGVFGGIIGKFTNLGGATGKAASSLGGLGSAAGSAAAPAASAGKAIGTLSQNALGFVALGAGILMASVGLTMMAKAAIELGQAGAPAAIAMAEMVAVLALLAVGAAALGPVLTAGAVGLVAFGAAITLVGLGVLAASAGLSMLAGHLPAIAQYGGTAAAAIGQLALAIAAFGLAAVAAAAGALALAAGLLAFSGGAVAATVAGVAFTAALLALTVAVIALTAAVVSFSAALVVLAAAIVAVGAAVLTSTTMIVNAFKVAGDAAKNTLEDIRNGFTNTFNAVRSFMSGIVNWLRGLFKFEWSLPKIKLPHFSISGSFSLNPPSIPSFSVDWYRKAMDGGMILNSPTIFGMSGGKFLGGGEAGPEAVVGVDSLRSMIQAAVAGAGGGGDIIIPVYIGQERIDETVVTASQRANYRSGGR